MRWTAPHDPREEHAGSRRDLRETPCSGLVHYGRYRLRAILLSNVTSGVGFREESHRGSVLVECALLVPVLLILMFGMVDLSRVFLTAITVTSAAQAGAEYGSSSSSAFTDYTGMQNAAAHDAAQLSSFTATASQYCSCSAGGTSVSC